MAAALGAGNTATGMITESTGTALAVIASIDTSVFDAKSKIPCSPHSVPGKYVLMPYCETSGIILKWFRDTFARSLEQTEDYSELMQLACEVPAGADGLLAAAEHGTIERPLDWRAYGALDGWSGQK